MRERNQEKPKVLNLGVGHTVESFSGAGKTGENNSVNIFPLGRVNMIMLPKCKRCRVEIQEQPDLHDYLGKKK